MMAFINIQSWKKNTELGRKPLKICVLILVVLLLASAFGFAEEGDKEELVAETGTIYRIEGAQIVINDCLYNLSPDFRFYTNSKMDTYASRSWLKVGTRVSFQINDNGEITAMWRERK